MEIVIKFLQVPYNIGQIIAYDVQKEKNLMKYSWEDKHTLLNTFSQYSSL